MKDILIRSAKTFAQAFIAVFTTAIAGGIDVKDSEALVALLVAAFAAGVSTVWNIILKALESK